MADKMDEFSSHLIIRRFRYINMCIIVLYCVILMKTND